MREAVFDTVVVGGGAAGLAASKIIAERGYRVALVERENRLGGILNQCIHNGFGLHYFKEELTGPEYAQRFIETTAGTPNIEVFLETTVMDVKTSRADNNNSGKGSTNSPGTKEVFCYSSRYGVLKIITKTIVLAMGSRERNRGNIGIPGTRPAGIFTAGLAQRFVNIEGYSPGENVVIIGSGDIGLIMARRMTLIGARVLAVIEIQPYPSGLTRNIVQCLRDFDIPLHLSHIVSRIYGRDRVEAVDVTPVRNGKPEMEETFKIKCDTLLLSVGLVPENELSKKFGVKINPETGGAVVDAHMMTSVDGVFSCGNVLHIHDLVDYVSEESIAAASFACDYMEERGKWPAAEQFPTVASSNIKYVIPNSYDPEINNRFFFRPMIVKNNAKLCIRMENEDKEQKTLLEKRLLHVQPSEMVSVNIKSERIKEFLRDGEENRLVFSIQ